MKFNIFLDSEFLLTTDHSIGNNTFQCSRCNFDIDCRKIAIWQSHRHKNTLSHIFTATHDFIYSLRTTIHSTNIEFICLRMFFKCFDFSDHKLIWKNSRMHFLNFTRLENQIFGNIFWSILHRNKFFEKSRGVFHTYSKYIKISTDILTNSDQKKREKRKKSSENNSAAPS